MGVPTVSSARALVESDEERMLILFPLRLLALWSNQTDRMHRCLVFNRAGGASGIWRPSGLVHAKACAARPTSACCSMVLEWFFGSLDSDTRLDPCVATGGSGSGSGALAAPPCQ